MRCIKPVRSNSAQSGYVLLAVLLAMTIMLIALSVEAPRIAQQIKRQKEEELVNRGKDYATAVKRFVHKNGGRFPLSIEQLEDTNHVRFLRKRYKDPMTGESDWRLVHFGEAQVTIPAPNPGLNNSTQNPGLGGGSSSPGGTGSTSAGNPPAGNPLAGSPITGNPTQPNSGTGTLTTTNIGNGQTAGGGQIIGVASVNKGQSIKEFNDKDHYNDWLFVYDLRLEQSGGTGVTVGAPMSPGATNAGGASGGNPAGATGSQNPPGNGQLGGQSGPGTSPPPAPAPSPN
jgi:type II secretory pathway pseudopilin PulG